MIVVDVLLGLNFLVLGACALRGQTSRRHTVVAAEAPPATVHVQRHAAEAKIIPFPSLRPTPGVGRAMALHPSAQAGTPDRG